MRAHTMIIATALLGFYTVSASAAPLPLNNPKDLAFDTNGNLDVASFGSGVAGPTDQQGEILVYNPQYLQLAGKSFRGGDINAPTGKAATAVACDNQGILYLRTPNARLIKCTYPTPSGSVCDEIRTVDQVPSDIAVDAKRDRICVSSDVRSTVDVFKRDGTFITTFH